MSYFFIEIIGDENKPDIKIYYSTSDESLVKDLENWINDAEIYICKHPNQLLRHYLQRYNESELETLDLKQIFNFFEKLDFSRYPVDLNGMHNLLMLRLDGFYRGSYTPPCELLKFIKSTFPDEPLSDWKFYHL